MLQNYRILLIVIIFLHFKISFIIQGCIQNKPQVFWVCFLKCILSVFLSTSLLSILFSSSEIYLLKKRFVSCYLFLSYCFVPLSDFAKAYPDGRLNIFLCPLYFLLNFQFMDLIGSGCIKKKKTFFARLFHRWFSHISI